MSTPRRYDYVIVGSGIAGLYTALLAREHGHVLVLTKSGIEDCNTRYAQGGIAAAVGPDDSPELHMEDTLTAGAGLCDPEAVRILTSEAPQAIADLVRLGVEFDKAQGEVDLAREGAHSAPRVLHAGGDATGARIELTLASLARLSRIRVLERALATEVLIDTEEGRACGIRVLDLGSGQEELFLGRHIVLATGGGGRLFRFTTNPEVATADGVALAFQAGATVRDMEFFQFHPTALHMPGAPPFLISEAVRGEGGILRNVQGRPFMQELHPLGDLAPRDVVSRAIVAEMRRTGSDHVLLDITHLPPSTVTARFPTISSTCLQYGLDITQQAIPIAPAAHYMMGGIKTNTWAETSVPGLYACGEVTSTGVHGANRLASNSLLETVVFGRRLVQRTLGEGDSSGSPGMQETHVPLEPPAPAVQAPPPSVAALQDLLWAKVGMVRDESGLIEASGLLDAWTLVLEKSGEQALRPLAGMVLLGRLMVQAALLRQESRGAHYRLDYPEPLEAWRKHIVLSLDGPRGDDGRRSSVGAARSEATARR
jgi:L-aspartate oxidase